MIKNSNFGVSLPGCIVVAKTWIDVLSLTTEGCSYFLPVYSYHESTVHAPIILKFTHSLFWLCCLVQLVVIYHHF